MPRAPLAAALLSLLIAPPEASATTIRPLSRKELAKGSDTVVRAVVEASRTFPSPKSGRPLTHTTLKILETWKGSPQKALTLEQLGGTVEGRTLLVPGDAALERGEEAVFFLRCHDGLCHLYGLALGKYAVKSGPSGERLAVRKGEGLKLPDGSTLEDASVPLATLQAEVRSAAP